MARLQDAEGAEQSHADAVAAAVARTQCPEKYLAEFMRANRLSNRIFTSFDNIVDHRCYAWITLIDQPWKIMSVARRDWATVGQSIRGLVSDDCKFVAARISRSTIQR